MPVTYKPTNVVISPFIRYSGTSAYTGEKWRGKIGEFRQTILSNVDGFLFRLASWVPCMAK